MDDSCSDETAKDLFILIHFHSRKNTEGSLLDWTLIAVKLHEESVI